MPVTANRFVFLDKQTNVATADLISQTTSDILNAPGNDLVSLPGNVTSLLGTNSPTSLSSLTTNGFDMSAVGIGQSLSSGLTASYGSMAGQLAQGPGSVSSVLSSTVSKVTSFASSLGDVRLTKDFMSSGINLNATPDAVLNKVAQSIGSGNPLLQTSIKQLDASCRDAMLGTIGAQKDGNTAISCSGTGISRYGNIGSCDINQFASLLANATGGAYNPSIYNQLNVENNLSMLANAGYKHGLCSVFRALTANMNNVDSVSRIASNVLGTAVNRGDMMTVLDVGTSIGANGVSGILPGIAGGIFNNYNQPAEVNNAGLSSFYGKFTNAVGNIDPNWSTSDTGSLSASNLGGSAASSSYDLNSMMLADTSNSVVDPTVDISTAAVPDSTFLYASNQFANTDVNTALSNELSF